MHPAIEAASPSLLADFPAMNCPPPFEKVTMIGPPYLAAASMQALMELVTTIFTPGIIYPFALASSRRSLSACPVTTPGFTEAGSLAKACTSCDYHRCNERGERLMSASIHCVRSIQMYFVIDSCRALPSTSPQL